MRKIAALLAMGLVLAACGSTKTAGKHTTTTVSSSHKAKSSTKTSTPTTSKTSPGTTTSVTPKTSGQSNSATLSNFPQPCSLATKAQVSSILSVPINSVASNNSSNSLQCTWLYETKKLTTGLGSNIVVNIDKVPPGQTPTQYYNVLFDNLNKPYGFHKIMVDNIPAAFGFANDEVLVDTGNATIIIASLSTVSGTDNGKTLFCHDHIP